MTTRLAILADIHGNLPALEAVMADMENFGPQQVVVAGDMVNGAPFSSEILEIIHQQRWVAIRGNHEFYALNHNTDRETPDQRGYPSFDWLCETLGDWMYYLAALPDETTLYYGNNPLIRVGHGTPGHNSRAITMDTPGRQVIEWLADVQEPLFIAGHYHVPFQRQVAEWQIISPGPVGMPQDGLRKAHYIWLEGDGHEWQITPRQLDYDFDRIETAYRDTRIYQQTDIMILLGYLQLRYAYALVNAFSDWHTANPTKERTPALVKQFLSDPDIIWDYLPERYQFRREGLEAIDPAVVDEKLSEWT